MGLLVKSRLNLMLKKLKFFYSR